MNAVTFAYTLASNAPRDGRIRGGANIEGSVSLYSMAVTAPLARQHTVAEAETATMRFLEGPAVLLAKARGGARFANTVRNRVQHFLSGQTFVDEAPDADGIALGNAHLVPPEEADPDVVAARTRKAAQRYANDMEYGKAARLAASKATPYTPTHDVATALLAKHPRRSPLDNALPGRPGGGGAAGVGVGAHAAGVPAGGLFALTPGNLDKLRKVAKKYKSKSAGPSGMHGTWLIACLTDDDLCRRVLTIVNHILAGDFARGPLALALRASTLLPLNTDPDDPAVTLRPVAMGEVLTRIASKLAKDAIDEEALFFADRSIWHRHFRRRRHCRHQGQVSVGSKPAVVRSQG